MRLVDIVRRSGRSLRSAKIRTLLTAMAIGVGGFTLTLTLAAGNGVRDYTETLVQSNFDPAELMVGRDREVSNTSSPSDRPQEFDDSVTSFQGGGPGSSFQVKQVTRGDINLIKQNPEVEQVRENFNLSIRYVTRKDQKRFTGSAEAYNPAQKPEVKTGELPNTGDIAKGAVLLPDVYLESLGFDSEQQALGQIISITAQQPFSATSIQALLAQAQGGNFANLRPESLAPQQETFEFKIAAVTKKPVTSLNFGVSPLLINAADARKIYDFTTKGTPDYDQFIFVNVRVKNGEDKAARQTVREKLESEGFYVLDSDDLQKTLTQFVDILQGLVGALGLITLVASIFGIVNTQYISVLERTREIGLMKALGMSKRNISRLFIFEAMWIGFMGGLLGIVGGYLLVVALNPWITETLDLGEGNALLIFSWWQTLVLLGSLILVGAFAGLLPARKAAKLDPVEALRTE